MMTQPKSHRKIFVIGGIVAAVMFTFCFAMVPLYSLICKKTGINTATANQVLTIPATKEQANATPDLSREITIQFVATNNMGMPWDFYPRVKSIRVHPGENAKVYFYAKNTTDKRMTVQAIPSITPTDSIGYFHKIECFCFTQQTLDAHHDKDMALIFTIDKSLPKNIHVITLAYTLFDTDKGKTDGHQNT